MRKLPEFQKLPRVYREFYKAVMKIRYKEAPNYIYLRNLFLIHRKIFEAE